METDDYVFFYSHQAQLIGCFMSQWYISKFSEEINGKTYNFSCAEQSMMFKKALLFKDMITANKILATSSQLEIKRLGRQVKNFNQGIWDKNKFDFVVASNIQKFSQNAEIRKKLLDTQNKTLVEASPYDKIWGIGMSFSDPNVLDSKKWKGSNLLGKALMKVRENLANIR